MISELATLVSAKASPRPGNYPALETSLMDGYLFTDQYELTMAQLYFRNGIHQRQALFEYSFRNYPDYGSHQAGYCISAGLEWLLRWMTHVALSDREYALLKAQHGRAGTPLFQADFLDWIRTCGAYGELSVRAVAEGRVVHRRTPLALVEGPLALGQMLETSLLNHLEYQTLVATKASRIREVTGHQRVLEFGARRGHDRGVHAGARASLIGGADLSSNVGASLALGVSPSGTHAHSMVQAFLAQGMSEYDAFQAYADLYPDDCLLLVDTIDTLQSGVPNAIRVFEKLRRNGHVPVGIRLDSGDLASLSIQAAEQLDRAGFPEVSITLSNQLDELTILQILTQIRNEAPLHGVDPDRLCARLVYGVGTKLITSHGASSLGGIYKLVALRDGERWTPALKLSDSPKKEIIPGRKRLWRLYRQDGSARADLISTDDEDPHRQESIRVRPVVDGDLPSTVDGKDLRCEPLLEDVFRNGAPTGPLADLHTLRNRRDEDTARLLPGVRRLVNPHEYDVWITEGLWRQKNEARTLLGSSGA